MRGLSRMETNIIRMVPIISLISLGVLFYLLFPIYENLSEWVLSDLGSIPFLVWMPLGMVLGFVIHHGMKRNSDLVMTYSRRVLIGIIGWFFLSVIVSIITETGDVFTRLDHGPLFKAWSVLMFILLSISPPLFGIYSIFSRKRWSMGASVSMFFILAIVCMIFSQGRYALALDQDPILSLLFIWSVIAFVESTSWKKRYIDRDRMDFPEGEHGKDLAGSLLRRQVSYTLLFTAAASVIAFTPLLLVVYIWTDPPGSIAYYEVGTVLGTALMGLVLMLPLMMFAIFRRWWDRRSQDEQIDDVET